MVKFLLEEIAKTGVILVRLTIVRTRQNVCLHCKKQVSDFSVPSRDVTNQTIPGGE